MVDMGDMVDMVHMEDMVVIEDMVDNWTWWTIEHGGHG